MKRYSILLLLLVLLGACEKTDNVTPADTSVMHFDMRHPSSVTKATANAFENKDKIGIFVTEYAGDVVPPLQISGNYANNVAATYDGSEWATAKKVFWSDQKMDVYAYYPYMTPKSIDEQPFSVALDQSTPKTADALGGYEASDFLWAKTKGVSQEDATVALQFRHCLNCKLVVKLVKGANYDGELPDDAKVYVHSVVPAATIDFTTGAVTKDLYAGMATITCHKVDNATYEAIIVPQRLESRRPFIEVVVGNVSYLLEDTFNFKTGKQHTYSLTVNSNPEQIEIEIGGQIDSDWK